MTNERMILFCAILTTLADLAEHNHSEVPQGHLYAGLLNRCTLSEFQFVVALMLTSGLATIYMDCLAITPRGRECATKIDAQVAASHAAHAKVTP